MHNECVITFSLKFDLLSFFLRQVNLPILRSAATPRLPVNEQHNKQNFLHMFYRIVVFNLKENFQESCENRWFSSMFSTYISRT